MKSAAGAVWGPWPSPSPEPEPAPIVVREPSPYVVERIREVNIIRERIITGTRRIRGWASTGYITSHPLKGRQRLDPMGAIIRMPIPVFSEHARDAAPIGKITVVRQSAQGIAVDA